MITVRFRASRKGNGPACNHVRTYDKRHLLFRTYPDEGSVSDIDLGSTRGECGGDLDGEVLVRRLARLVILGVEFAVVKDSSHDLVSIMADARSARGNADRNGHLGRSSEGVLLMLESRLRRQERLAHTGR